MKELSRKLEGDRELLNRGVRRHSVTTLVRCENSRGDARRRGKPTLRETASPASKIEARRVEMIH
ncbi:MAG TPA: hypothetical protein VHU13_04750, partial [Solirubrobacteraceae bacterium]|nr:hypothetical protein [Solirubrobacteraceae bacterium]